MGTLLQRYAHQFTLVKLGCDAELVRINHYLLGAGLHPLRRDTENGRAILKPLSRPVGSGTPKAWIRYLEARRSRRAGTHRLVRAIGATLCAQLTTARLRELASTMRADRPSESTVQKELALLKAAFNVAIREWGWSGFVNPVIGITLGRSRRRFVRPTDDEEDRLV